MRALVAFELLSVLSFGGLATWTLLDRGSSLPTIDVAAMATGTAEEQWLGIL